MKRPHLGEWDMRGEKAGHILGPHDELRGLHLHVGAEAFEQLQRSSFVRR